MEDTVGSAERASSSGFACKLHAKQGLHGSYRNFRFQQFLKIKVPVNYSFFWSYRQKGKSCLIDSSPNQRFHQYQRVGVQKRRTNTIQEYRVNSCHCRTQTRTQTRVRAVEWECSKPAERERASGSCRSLFIAQNSSRTQILTSLFCVVFVSATHSSVDCSKWPRGFNEKRERERCHQYRAAFCLFYTRGVKMVCVCTTWFLTQQNGFGSCRLSPDSRWNTPPMYHQVIDKLVEC